MDFSSSSISPPSNSTTSFSSPSIPLITTTTSPKPDAQVLMVSPPPSYQTALLQSFTLSDMESIIELASRSLTSTTTTSNTQMNSSLQTSHILSNPSRSTEDEQPLDLSCKPSFYTPSVWFNGGGDSSSTTVGSSSTSTHRPSVILDGTNLRRSVSSVTSSNKESDVSEHFRRSLSGKWPRRIPSMEDRRLYRRPPLTVSPSIISSRPSSRSLRDDRRITSSSPSCNNNNTIVITANSPESIEDVFRRALGVEEFEEFKKSVEERKKQKEETIERF